MSQEHLIPKSVLRVIKKDKLVVTGLPRLGGAENVALGINAVVAECLCTAHNNALGVLDAEAARFFRSFEQCDLNRTKPARHFLFSGHDIERWLIKTMASFAVSKEFTHERVPLSGEFHPEIPIDVLLEDPLAWGPGAGLYYTQQLDQRFTRKDEIWLQPLTTPDDGQLVGMKVGIQGFEFEFVALPAKVKPGRRAIYRPQRFNFDMPDVNNTIEISWEDGASRHPIKVTFLETVAEARQKGLPVA